MSSWLCDIGTIVSRWQAFMVIYPGVSKISFTTYIILPQIGRNSWWNVMIKWWNFSFYHIYSFASNWRKFMMKCHDKLVKFFVFTAYRVSPRIHKNSWWNVIINWWNFSFYHIYSFAPNWQKFMMKCHNKLVKFFVLPYI